MNYRRIARTVGCALALLPALALGQITQTGPHTARSQSPFSNFRVTSVSVVPGAVWKINRPIDVQFNLDVDFATVSLNTIQVQATRGGEPAVGTFTLVSSTTVRFQPNCPVLEDYSDAGLQPGGVGYRLSVPDLGSGVLTVQSTAGDGLAQGAFVPFSTPTGMSPLDLFIDTVPGPPTALVRGRAGVPLDAFDATYLELGEDPDNRVYVEWDPSAQMGFLELPGFEVPINHYSIVDNHVALVVWINQSVNPLMDNLSRLTLEWSSGPGMWERIGTRVELEANCTDAGARVRLTPLGILPQGSELRLNINQGFQDITGESILLDNTNSVSMETRTSTDPGTMTQGDDGDELLEQFVIGGDGPDSFEDTTSVLGVPAADWGNGELRASFDFGGTGGPNGTFDWFIPPATNLVLNTTADTIIGGPNGVPTDTQNVIGGVVDVRDLFIPSNSTLTIVGPNPCTILCSGKAEIRGPIFVRGTSIGGVGGLNTTDQPEPGGLGNGGGGRGGTGSFLVTASTPRGGHGFGAFQVPDGGGQGGETSYHPVDVNSRRGAGGGGGRLGPDVLYDFMGAIIRSQTLVGMDAEPGFAGAELGLGAISQSVRAMGGVIGASPFVDGDPTNDFFGTLVANPGTADERRVHGELDTLWAGGGGGAGGDAVRSDSFPLVPFTVTGDEKGAGGGGAGGGLRILALCEIRVANDGISTFGRIAVDGGHGGGGENTNFFNRVGGGSGGGSGGHIVLSSAKFIEIGGSAEGADDWYSDSPALNVHGKRTLSALGGQGGVGNQNRGGADETGASQWRCDAIPFAHFEGLTNVPPSADSCFMTHPDLLDPLGPVVGAGGDGGPGLIQLHVKDPAANLRFPDVVASGGGTTYGVDLDVSRASVPPPVGWHSPSAPADAMVPFFGAESAAQSEWIALGLARVNPGGPDDVQQFFFGGTEADGSVSHTGTAVELEAPIIGPTALLTGPNRPYVTPSGTTVVFDASVLASDLLKRNPHLARLYTVRLFETGNESNEMLYSAAAASYRVQQDELIVTVSQANGLLSDFMPAGGVQVAFVPRSYQVVAGGVFDTLPANTRVEITFDAALAGPDGKPDASSALGFTPDIQMLNAQPWDFFRFRVFFDLDEAGTGIDLASPLPGLGHLRGPFRF